MGDGDKMEDGENPKLPRKLTRKRYRFKKECVVKRSAHELAAENKAAKAFLNDLNSCKSSF